MKKKSSRSLHVFLIAAQLIVPLASAQHAARVSGPTTPKAIPNGPATRPVQPGGAQLSPAATVPRKNGNVIHRTKPSTLVNGVSPNKGPLSRAMFQTVPMTPRGSLTDLQVLHNPVPALSNSAASADAAVYADARQPLTFRVETRGYGVQQRSWMLQFSTQAQPTHAPDRCSAWETTPGLLTAEPLHLALSVRTAAPEHHAGLKALTLSEMRMLSRHEAGVVQAGVRQGRPSAEFPLVVPAAIKKPVAYPATIYMRLVPLDAASHCSQPPSNWVSIFVPGTQNAVTEVLEKKRQQTIDNEKAAAIARIQSQYSVEVLSYIPGKLRDDHVASDDVSHYILLARPHLIEGQYWQAGATIDAEAVKIQYFTPKKTFLQQYWDLFTGELNLVSAGYEAAKSFVVDAIVTGLNATQVMNCQESCRADIKTGLEATLAYCGIPPSIPNVAALYDRGASYLAQNIASYAVAEISGVDIGDSLLGTAAKETAEAAVREEGYQAARGGIDALVSQLVCIDPTKADCAAVADDPYSWGPPAPYYRARPSVLWLRIKRTAPPQPGIEKIQGLLVGVGPYYTAKAVYPITYIPAEGLIVPVILTPVNTEPFNMPSAYFSDTNCSNDAYNGPACGQPVYQEAPWIELEIYTTHLTKSSVIAHGALTAVQWPTQSIRGGFIYRGDHPPADGTYYGQLFLKDVDGTLVW